MITISLFGLTSVLCFGLPVLVIVLFRLYRHTSLIALALYYGLAICHCLNAETIPPVPNFNNPFDVAYTYLEIPLMLTALLFFCPAKQRQRNMHTLIGFFIVYEIAISIFAGFSPKASVYIMAPGLLVVVLYAAFLFLRQAKFTIMHRKNSGRVLMLGAILFSYTAYLFVFYTYFIQEQKEIASVYNIYFISSTIASLLMSVGLFMMRFRIKELQELKVVRRELQMVFGS
jgi:hypothetical protein